MKTTVTFSSIKFPPYEGDDSDEVNPGIWGKRLSEYMAQKLEAYGIKVTDIIAEDWGFYLPIENPGFRMALCCGKQSSDDDQFIINTHPEKPKIRKLFRTIDITPQLTRLVDAINIILESDADIHDINWID